MIDVLFQFLNQRKIYYKENVSIKKMSSIRIGEVAPLVVYPSNSEDMIATVELSLSLDIPYKIIGRLTNILPSDEKCEKILISTSKLNKYLVSNTTVICECGALLSFVLSRISLLNLGGAEALISIPGTVGGMVYSNAGAYGKEISDFFKSADIYDIEQKRTINFSRRDMDFEYRTSTLRSGKMILLNAELDFFEKSADEIFRDMSHFKALRREKQPVGYPSLGSVFKRVDGTSAGALIDECGLKGLRVGGAMISQKHAGFIINYSGATSEDVKTLIRICEDAVFEKFGIRLEREIEFL